MIAIKKFFQLAATIGNGQRWIVGDVVGVTHECVNGGERVALLGGEDEKSVIEILGRGTRDVTADAIRRAELERVLLHGGAHAIFLIRAPSTRRSLRDLEMTGRWRRTS